MRLLNMRNEGAMLSDPTVREGYVQGAVARGLEAAGSNSNGSMAGFMGMGMASNIIRWYDGSGIKCESAADADDEWRCTSWNDAGGGACDTSCWAGGTASTAGTGRLRAGLHVDSRIRENSVPTVENRHRKPGGEL